MALALTLAVTLTLAISGRGEGAGEKCCCGDFAELANAGEAVMRPMPQSGTAPRAAARALPMLAGALLGNAAGTAGSALAEVATITRVSASSSFTTTVRECIAPTFWGLVTPA